MRPPFSNPRAPGLIAALAAALVCWAAPSHATVEYIGRINGNAVYLVWGNECSALPAGTGVTQIQLTYTGPPQPGVFTDVQLDPPFDTYSTDGLTTLTVFASTPMPMPCDECHQFVFRFHTTVEHVAPGEAAPFQFAEYDAGGGSCSGVVHRSMLELAPSFGGWGLGLLAASLLAGGALWIRRRATVQASAGSA